MESNPGFGGESNLCLLVEKLIYQEKSSQQPTNSDLKCDWWLRFVKTWFLAQIFEEQLLKNQEKCRYNVRNSLLLRTDR